MLFIPKSGATGKTVLVHTCAQSHNPKLDRDAARFADRRREGGGIRRINLPASDRLHMPPALMRSLPDAAAIAALQ